MGEKSGFERAQESLDEMLEVLPKALGRKKARARGWYYEPKRHSLSARGIPTTAKEVDISNVSERQIASSITQLNEDIEENDLLIHFDMTLEDVPKDVEITSQEEAEPYEEPVLWLTTPEDISVGVWGVRLSPYFKTKKELASWWVRHRQSILYWLRNEEYDKIKTMIKEEK